MKTCGLCAVLFVAVSAASCGGDDFSSQSSRQDASVHDGAGEAGSQEDGAQQDTAQQDAPSSDVEEACAIQTTLAACDHCINTECLEPCQKCAANASCQDIFGCVIASYVHWRDGSARPGVRAELRASTPGRSRDVWGVLGWLESWMRGLALRRRMPVLDRIA
jgi:hypothetical protein